MRRAEQGDHDFLTDMLVEAVTADLGREEVLADGKLRRYVQGWMRPGDDGVIALGPHGPVGAVWWRLFTATEPGYGFMAEDVPELSLALRPEARGRGTGRALLRAALAGAAAEHSRMSLSVDRANPARRLYVAEGFGKVGEDGTSDVMVVDLSRRA